MAVIKFFSDLAPILIPVNFFIIFSTSFGVKLWARNYSPSKALIKKLEREQRRREKKGVQN